MGDSHSAMFSHLVFSTKNRQPFLVERNLRLEMHSVIGGISKDLGSPPVIVGGVEDHVHLLATLGGDISKNEWVKEIKRRSSIWVKERDPSLKRFAWQRGSGVFSVSPSHVNPLIEYIRNQEEHHKRISSRDEFIELLKKYNLPFDEKYL